MTQRRTNTRHTKSSAEQSDIPLPKCAVCFKDIRKSSKETSIELECQGCKQKVHRYCYRPDFTRPKKEFMCDLCSWKPNHKASVCCSLCRQNTGMLRKCADSDTFVHVLCALFSERATLKSYSKMDIELLPPKEKSQIRKCQLCSSPLQTSNALTCLAQGCTIATHPTCAQSTSEDSILIGYPNLCKGMIFSHIDQTRVFLNTYSLMTQGYKLYICKDHREHPSIVWCPCQRQDSRDLPDQTIKWVQCKKCMRWYHDSCSKLSNADQQEFQCEGCLRSIFQPISFIRKQLQMPEYIVKLRDLQKKKVLTNEDILILTYIPFKPSQTIEFLLEGSAKMSFFEHFSAQVITSFYKLQNSEQNSLEKLISALKKKGLGQESIKKYLSKEVCEFFVKKAPNRLLQALQDLVETKPPCTREQLMGILVTINKQCNELSSDRQVNPFAPIRLFVRSKMSAVDLNSLVDTLLVFFSPLAKRLPETVYTDVLNKKYPSINEKIQQSIKKTVKKLGQQCVICSVSDIAKENIAKCQQAIKQGKFIWSFLKDMEEYARKHGVRLADESPLKAALAMSVAVAAVKEKVIKAISLQQPIIGISGIKHLMENHQKYIHMSNEELKLIQSILRKEDYFEDYIAQCEKFDSFSNESDFDDDISSDSSDEDQAEQDQQDKNQLYPPSDQLDNSGNKLVMENDEADKMGHKKGSPNKQESKSSNFSQVLKLVTKDFTKGDTGSLLAFFGGLCTGTILLYPSEKIALESHAIRLMRLLQLGAQDSFFEMKTVDLMRKGQILEYFALAEHYIELYEEYKRYKSWLQLLSSRFLKKLPAALQTLQTCQALVDELENWRMKLDEMQVDTETDEKKLTSISLWIQVSLRLLKPTFDPKAFTINAVQQLKKLMDEISYPSNILFKTVSSLQKEAQQLNSRISRFLTKDRLAPEANIFEEIKFVHSKMTMTEAYSIRRSLQESRLNVIIELEQLGEEIKCHSERIAIAEKGGSLKQLIEYRLYLVECPFSFENQQKYHSLLSRIAQGRCLSLDPPCTKQQYDRTVWLGGSDSVSYVERTISRMQAYKAIDNAVCGAGRNKQSLFIPEGNLPALKKVLEVDKTTYVLLETWENSLRQLKLRGNNMLRKHTHIEDLFELEAQFNRVPILETPPRPIRELIADAKKGYLELRRQIERFERNLNKSLIFQSPSTQALYKRCKNFQVRSAEITRFESQYETYKAILKYSPSFPDPTTLFLSQYPQFRELCLRDSTIGQLPEIKQLRLQVFKSLSKQVQLSTEPLLLACHCLLQEGAFLSEGHLKDPNTIDFLFKILTKIKVHSQDQPINSVQSDEAEDEDNYQAENNGDYHERRHQGIMLGKRPPIDQRNKVAHSIEINDDE